MKRFTLPEIADYAAMHSTVELPVLAELNRETHVKVLNPRMLSGHIQGLLLQLFSKMISPTTILEIGTYTGYSAICLAQGLKPNGYLYTIDINEELNEMILRYVAKAELSDKIKLLTGNALHIIPELNQTFDIVFIDADKENYCNYYNLIFDKVNPGGYILTDNVLWDGKVVYPEKYKDVETQSLIAFNTMIKNDERVEQLLLPIRDGLYVIRKK